MTLALDDHDVIDVKVSPMIVVLRDSSRGDMHFKVKMTTRIFKLFRLYAENQGISLTECEFYFGDEKIKDYKASLAELGIGDNDIIIVLRHIIIRIKDIDGEETLFKMKQSSRMTKMFEAYSVTMNTPVSNLEFILNGEKIEDSNATPMSLELESDDVINVRRIAEHID